MGRQRAAATRRRNRNVKRKAERAEELKRKAESALDVDKMLRLKREAIEAIETKCFPLTAARKKLMAAAATQPSGSGTGKEKKKKVIKKLVAQEHIDLLLKMGLYKCVDEVPEDELAKEHHVFRDGYRAKMLLTEKMRACQQSLLDQYNAFGYAYDVAEVTDDEEEAEAEAEVVKEAEAEAVEEVVVKNKN